MPAPMLSDTPDHDLIGYCANYGPGEPCRHSAKLDRAALLARYGDMDMDEFRRRMRCTVCGHRGGSVRLVTRSGVRAEWPGAPPKSG